MNEVVQEIFTDRITDPKDPMRTELDRAGLFELADNIKQNGLINPITVRPVGDMYEVVAGHRRLSACRIAGLIKIQCIVRELDDNKTFEVMAAENLERADVNPVDESVFIARYIEQTGKTLQEVSKALRRSVQWVETRLAVGKMPDYMQQHVRAGTLKLGAALALVEITDDNVRRMWVDMAARDGVSVAQAEYWLHGWKVGQLPGAEPATTPPQGYEAGSAPVIKFECAIDGQKYDAATFKSVMIHNENMAVFNEFVRLFRATPPPVVSNAAAESAPPASA